MNDETRKLIDVKQSIIDFYMRNMRDQWGEVKRLQDEIWDLGGGHVKESSFGDDYCACGFDGWPCERNESQCHCGNPYDNRFMWHSEGECSG